MKENNNNSNNNTIKELGQNTKTQHRHKTEHDDKRHENKQQANTFQSLSLAFMSVAGSCAGLYPSRPPRPQAKGGKPVHQGW